jgi:hypothetical protein
VAPAAAARVAGFAASAAVHVAAVPEPHDLDDPPLVVDRAGASQIGLETVRISCSADRLMTTLSEPVTPEILEDPRERTAAFLAAFLERREVEGTLAAGGRHGRVDSSDGERSLGAAFIPS